MIVFHRLKKLINPLNSVVTGVIILFICSRVFLNNHENDFVIEAIASTELQTEVQTEIRTEVQIIVSEGPQAVVKVDSQMNTQTMDTQMDTQVDSQSTSQLKTNFSERLAYSAELDKTFTLDAFNLLSKEELMTFSGIGEVTAQAILDYRHMYGPFGQFEDLMLVKGIGEKKLQKIMSILP